MFHKDVEVKEGAVFIADVHYKKGDSDFLDLLSTWYKSPPPQIFLVGDIFHALLPFKYLIDYNSEAIALINMLALKSEVYYLQGNHDFNIESLFVNVNFADAFWDKKRDIFLTHGHLNSDIGYNIFFSLLKNEFLELFAHFVSFNFLYPWVFKSVLNKKICCKEIENFFEIAKKRLSKVDSKILVEGHYHQGKSFEIEGKEYINLPSFYCSKKYSVFEASRFLNKPYR